MINLLTDLHLHSLASGHAFNTVDEIINFASDNGYELIGISDHGSQMEGAPHDGYYEMLYRLPKNSRNMKIRYGCEANILDQSGRLDVSPTLAKKLDYVIAGLHRRTPYTGTTVAENTASIVAAMQSGLVDIVSHPISLNFMTDAKEIVEAARQYEVILEVNKSVITEVIIQNRQDVIEASRLLFAEARKAKVPLLFGSDAHHVSEMGITSQERERLSKFYDLDFDKLVNRDTAFVLEFLSKRHAP